LQPPDGLILLGFVLVAKLTLFETATLQVKECFIADVIDQFGNLVCVLSTLGSYVSRRLGAVGGVGPRKRYGQPHRSTPHRPGFRIGQGLAQKPSRPIALDSAGGAGQAMRTTRRVRAAAAPSQI
jgi:hypothetical protein